MARVRVTGLEILSEGQTEPQVLPTAEQEWGIHGPAQTPWVERHVYWVLPVGTVLLVLLVLAAFDFFDKPAPTQVVQPTISQPATIQPNVMQPMVVQPVVVQPVVLSTPVVKVEVPSLPSSPEPSPEKPKSIWDSPANR